MSVPDAVVGAAACARCAAMQRTCCQRAEILVTAGDVARIRRHAGRDSFWERRAPTDPAYAEFDPDDPEWSALTVQPDGTRRVLRRRANGDCTFLAETGCVLPVTVRPLVCRLYPHAYTAAGLIGVDSEYCPTAQLAPDGRPMTEVLDIPAATAEGWRRQLYEELRDGAA